VNINAKCFCELTSYIRVKYSDISEKKLCLFNLENDYILITNLMHWLLFIHKILFSSTCFEPQVLIFRRIQLYTRTCSIWYCHSLWDCLVACRYTDWV